MAKKIVDAINDIQDDYPLQNHSLDIPLGDVWDMTQEERDNWISDVLTEFAKEVKADTFALKKRVPFAKEMRDLRKCYRIPYDSYLFMDETGRSYKRDVLGRGSPGATHMHWSRTQMWKMGTKFSSLQKEILTKKPSLVRNITRWLDPDKAKTNKMWKNSDLTKMGQGSSIKFLLKSLSFNTGTAAAFPPFHARFFAEMFLPKDRDAIIFDPCAGWGGRLVGSLLCHTEHKLHYVATDPEKRNKTAYDGLARRVNVYMGKEVKGEREASVFYEPFEKWVKSAAARKFKGKVDMAITSPPYFDAENYNEDNPNQSANMYPTYDEWREGFYRPFFEGVHSLLRPEAKFILNVADVRSSLALEKDARKLAKECGFRISGYYKLAMSVQPGTKKTLQKNTTGSGRHSCMVDGSLFKFEPVFVFTKNG